MDNCGQILTILDDSWQFCLTIHDNSRQFSFFPSRRRPSTPKKTVLVNARWHATRGKKKPLNESNKVNLICMLNKSQLILRKKVNRWFVFVHILVSGKDGITKDAQFFVDCSLHVNSFKSKLWMLPKHEETKKVPQKNDGDLVLNVDCAYFIHSFTYSFSLRR